MVSTTNRPLYTERSGATNPRIAADPRTHGRQKTHTHELKTKKNGRKSEGYSQQAIFHPVFCSVQFFIRSFRAERSARA